MKNTEPGGDAVAAILCGACGGTFFTNPGNRALVIEMEMWVRCLPCWIELVSREKEIRIAGRISNGKIEEFEL